MAAQEEVNNTKTGWRGKGIWPDIVKNMGGKVVGEKCSGSLGKPNQI